MKISDNYGNSIEVLIPELSTVSLSQGLKFQVCNHNVNDWVSRQIKDETFDTERNYYLYLVADTVSKFTGQDLNSMLKWNINDLLDENGDLYEGVLTKHITSEQYSKDDIGVENLLLYLHGQLLNLFKEYKYEPIEVGEDYFFTYKGKRFKIPHLVKSMILGKKVHTRISIGQSVDILKIKKHLNNVIGYKEGKELTNKMNMTYVSYLQILAILALEENEEYPTNPEAAKTFVQERVEFFKDIDYITANEVVFFLTTIGKVSEKIKTSSTISTLPKKKCQTKPSEKMISSGKGQVMTRSSCGWLKSVVSTVTRILRWNQ